MTEDPSAPIAPISRRAIAYVIDAFIQTALVFVLIGAVIVTATVVGPQGMLTALLIGGIIAALLILGWLVIYTLMQAGRGSIGMRAQGLRLATATGGARLGFGRALLRNIVFWAACAIVVGYFTPLFDGSGRFQGWHDKAAGALMLNANANANANVASAQTAKTDAAPAMTKADAAAPASADIAPAAEAPATRPAPAPAPSSAPPVASTDQGALIAFVPGVSRSFAAREDAPVAQTGVDELDATVQAPPATAAPPAPSRPDPAAPSPAPVAPEPDDIEDTRISIPGHRLVFTWDDGTRTSVSRRTIFGRNPTPEDGAVIVSVRDETLSLSKTHFEAAAEASGGWVRDRHSTNGMTLVRDGQRIACPAGQRVTVRLGDAIEIGDRIVTIGGYA